MGSDKPVAAVDAEGTGACVSICRLVLADLPDGRRRPVATLKAEFETDRVSFEEATRFLDPRNWPRGSEVWQSMRQRWVTPTGVHRYHEIVGTTGANLDTAWTVEAELDFVFRWIPDVLAVTEYQLGEGHPAAGDDVLVDEGSLVVRKITPSLPRLRVTTTKRVKFSGPFGGEALAMIMAPMGYGDYAREMFLRCAALETEADDGASPTWQSATTEDRGAVDPEEL
jgi:hypothetical protein